MKQAVVLIHGIGEQKPMDTLRTFAGAVLPPADKGEERYWSKPDKMSELFELRRLTTPGRTKTDFYEYYWAYHVEGTKWRHLAHWFFGLLLRRWGNIPQGLRSIWLISWILLMMLAALTALGNVAHIQAWYAAQPYFGPAWVVSALAVLSIQGFLIYYVGDAARYLSPSPQNIALRQKIRAEGVYLLRQLHDSNKYDRIIVVGHSLGSVIGYDIITRLWLDYNTVYDFKTHAPSLANLLARHAPPQPVIKKRLFQVGCALSAASDLQTLQDFRSAQVEAWKEQRRWGNPWRITDFATIGSPLAHAMLLLASDGKDFTARKGQRELLTCPPVNDKEGYGYTDRPLPLVGYGRLFSPYILHHAAAFAVTRWTNLYFPASFGLFGDVIGGPLRDVLGLGIRDIPVKVRNWRRFTWLSHTAYWKERFMEDYALDALIRTLSLDSLRHFRVNPQTYDAGKELLDLTWRIGEAEKRRDALFFKELLADTLTFRRTNGMVVDKDTFLKELMNSANTFDSLESEDITVEIHEGVATVTLIVRAKGMREGKPLDGVYRNIRIFVREGDTQPKWKLHSWFNVRIPATTTFTQTAPDKNS